MEFVFNCPHCNRELAAADNAHGQTVVCPACKQSLIVPHSAPAAPPGLGHDEEIVEVLEEFRPPQPAEPPPLASRGAGGAASLLPPVKQRPVFPSDLTEPTPMMRAQLEREQRRQSLPIQRRAHLLVFGATIIFCLLLATIIVLVTQLPGGNPAATASAKALAATAPSATPDLSRLSPEETQELALLIKRAFDTLPPEEGREANIIYSRINQRQPTTQEQVARFNSLFQKGANLLTAEQQQRLTMLFAKTIQSPGT
ncbi:MAG: hypothetical protein HZC54_03070 [Verrucomicrobia bacterium]|nr:hypothetical protein [Verrucomicrobiota bacterium]